MLIRGYVAHDRIEIIGGPVFVASRHFPRSDEYPYISGIDDYGDTLFNHLQMDQFLEEWDRLPVTADLSPDERSAFNRVRELAVECRQAQQGVLLLFEGD